MVHLAVAAVINALWDLWAKMEGKVSVINALWDLWAKMEGKVSVTSAALSQKVKSQIKV